MSTTKASSLLAKDALFSTKPPMVFSDGKSNGATSFRHMNTQQMTIDTNRGSSTPTDILIFAGYNNNIRWISRTNNEGTETIGYSSSYNTCPKFYALADTVYAQAIGGAKADNRLTSWRTVAAGARFACINNQAEDEGWWEAARVRPEWRGNNHVFEDSPTSAASLPASSTVPNDAQIFAGTVPNKAEAKANIFVDYKEDISGLASYVTGKLRDLHHHSFRLKRMTKEHPFIDFTKEGVAQEDSNVNIITSTYNAEKTPTLIPFMDPVFDAILIRIHGRTVSNSLLMMNVIQTCQYKFDENSIFSQAALELNKRPIKSRSRSRSRRKLTKRRRTRR